MEALFLPRNDEGLENFEETCKKYSEMVKTLPKEKGWMTKEILQYQGYWFNSIPNLMGIMIVQNHFKARKSDIILAAFMKCGNTWLRSLMFATMNRYVYDFSDHPLLNTGPHACFPFLDLFVLNGSAIANLEALPDPRLLATHIPYALLSENVAATGCKFVYIWRDPKDVLVSNWYFTNKIRKDNGMQKQSFEEAFELFCDGICEYGPFWDHVLGYWKASLEMPENVLVLKYEDMKKEPVFYLKRLAEFMGKPFTKEEVLEGVVDKILELCSFEKLSNFEVNKTGKHYFIGKHPFDNSNFFRKGEVGDFQNHLTDEMIERIDGITREKFNGSGLI